MKHDANLALTPGALQIATLVRIGPHTDGRVASILEQAVWSIEHEVATWEGSAGHVRSHRVCLGVTASLLGSVRGHPHLEDEVARVVSVAISARPNETAGEVSFYYDPRAPLPLASSAYRGALPPALTAPAPSDRGQTVDVLVPPRVPDPDCAWEELARDYLVARGSPEIADVVGRARIGVDSALVDGARRHHVHVGFAPCDRAGTARVGFTEIDACVRDLLTGARGDVVHVDHD